MFVLPGLDSPNQIFINATSETYVGATEGGLKGFPASDFITYSATAARHEQVHAGGQKSEMLAYTEQKRVLDRFGPGAFSGRDFYEQKLDLINRGIAGEFGP
jgi:hypothetical protein